MNDAANDATNVATVDTTNDIANEASDAAGDLATDAAEAGATAWTSGGAAASDAPIGGTAATVREGALGGNATDARAILANAITAEGAVLADPDAARTDGAPAADASPETRATLAASSDPATTGLSPDSTIVRGDANATDLARAALDAARTGASADDARTLARDAANAATDRARRAASAADRAAQDPLARLLEGAELPELRPTRPTSAVAGRLAEVEGAIARDRVAAALERGAPSGDPAPVAASGPDAARSGALPSAIPAAATPPTLATASPAASLGAIADGTARAPASDLAATLAADDAGQSPAAARLAAKGMELLASQRGGSITMRLEPPALGPLRIQLHVAQGAVVADFSAATAEARALLDANLGMLRERLESQGLSVERLTVHGGRGTDTAAATSSSQQGDARQDGTDARDRGDRGAGEGRRDAADGESRGRRDGEPRRDGQDDAGARMRGGQGGERRGFASVLAGTAESRRAG
ncbi:MAG: hypothetical protein RI967_1933 [Planctomycetota bacterium]